MKQGISCPRKAVCTHNFCNDSPSFLADDESVIRVLLYPGHINKNKELKLGAFSKKDFVQKGFSVNRKCKLNISSYTPVIQNLEKSSCKKAFCFGVFEVKQVRNINEGLLMFCPSSNNKNPSHADIYAKSELSDEVFDEIRRELVHMIKIFSCTQDIF